MISVPGPGRRLQRVINLSARKARVISECVRVLRPSGELCVSDLTIMEGTPALPSSRNEGHLRH